ncbi:DUF2304 domain-containing protein [Clostridium perfringens]|uniref:DUF2304 domain-containing protein n=1 Tax=Clostridium perfringens TaxID=1502 RepID=UPI002247109A|nr:DUF2304 domain-containing protein [Clostridium perfringens]MCX0356050.1 DUF2304 domain-containing protein [Clostridium perfringens]
MDRVLQCIILSVCVLFTIYIINMINKENLELKYALTWLFSSFGLIIIAIFPQILEWISIILHILSPVNALFLIMIFFLLVIIFTLTIALSKCKKQIISISQEVGILKEKIERGENN